MYFQVWMLTLLLVELIHVKQTHHKEDLQIYQGKGIIKSPKQRLETYCFCSVSSSYYYYSLSFFPWTMNLSTADLGNYWTEFHETW